MTPVRELDVIVWALSSLALGALAGTYVRPAFAPRPEQARPGRSGLLGGLFAVFAIGCPVCNKLVVLALGLSGALTYFAPLQPLLGAVAVVLPLWALRRRLQTLGEGCAIQPAGALLSG